jgi:hypothetical protein
MTVHTTTLVGAARGEATCGTASVSTKEVVGVTSDVANASLGSYFLVVTCRATGVLGNSLPLGNFEVVCSD